MGLSGETAPTRGFRSPTKNAPPKADEVVGRHTLKAEKAIFLA
jgi:hypothetical protein